MYPYSAEIRLKCRLKIWSLGVNAHLSAHFVLPFKPHIAVNGREERVIAADADVVSGVDVCAALPNEDASRRHVMPGKPLDTEPFSDTVTSVAGTAAAFFMSHLFPPYLVDCLCLGCQLFSIV